MAKVKLNNLKIDISSWIVDAIGLTSIQESNPVRDGIIIEFTFCFPGAKRISVKRNGKTFRFRVIKS